MILIYSDFILFRLDSVLQFSLFLFTSDLTCALKLSHVINNRATIRSQPKITVLVLYYTTRKCIRKNNGYLDKIIGIK